MYLRKYLHLYGVKGYFEILGVRAIQKYHRTNHLGCTSKVPDFFAWLTLKFRIILVPTTTMAAPMFRTQGVVYNAPGVASKTGSIAKSLGATSVFLVTDQMLVSIGMAKIIVDSVEAAGLQCIVFDGVVPNPTVSCINEGIRQLQACAPGTVVVTLGGGSVMDCGKSIAVISAQEKDADVRDFYGQPKLNPKTDTIDLRSMAPKKRPTKLSPRIIAIPTTSGTGR